MGEGDGPNACEGGRPMTGSVPAPTASKPLARRTRVKLRRINSDYSKPYPPDGDNKLWWARLKKALGTTSSDFVNATLVQIQNASRLPCGGISEMSVNAVPGLHRGGRAEERGRGGTSHTDGLRARRHHGDVEQGRWRLWRQSARRHDGGSGCSATARFHSPGRDYAQAPQRRNASHSHRKGRGKGRRAGSHWKSQGRTLGA